MFHPSTCNESQVCQIRAAIRELDEPRENLERELLYGWKRVEDLQKLGLQKLGLPDQVDAWLGIISDVEDALEYVYLARNRWMERLPDVLIPLDEPSP